jgi:hypothetical protein
MIRVLMIMALVLAGCSGPQLPLSKSEPVSPQDQLVQPPWEALVKAGPDAYKDIDFETLDGPGATGATAATDAASPPIPGAGAAPAPPSSLAPGQLAANEAGAKQVADSVAIVAIAGAKGAGNRELVSALTAEFQKAGWPVAPKRSTSTIQITGKITFAKHPDGERISIVWTVKTPDGRPMGDVKQENVVPTGSVDDGFGEAAPLIAEGAASGIFELVGKYQQ